MALYTVLPNGFIQRDDGAIIPRDVNNFDYLDYLGWLVLGNSPDIAPDNTADTAANPVVAGDWAAAMNFLLGKLDASEARIAELEATTIRGNARLPAQAQIGGNKTTS